MKPIPTRTLAMLKRRGFNLVNWDGVTVAIKETVLTVPKAIEHCRRLNEREKTARWRKKRAKGN